MKTRDDIYRGEVADLLRIVTNYHTITFEQALMFLPKKEETTKTLIRKLLKQKRLYFDEEKNLLCDCAESAASPDYGMIASIWVLLDFKKSIQYHTSSDFPTKIIFFAQEEVYEIIYVPIEQEALINHVLSTIQKDDSNRLIVLEFTKQATQINVSGAVAYCLVENGVVSYYQKGGTTNEQN